MPSLPAQDRGRTGRDQICREDLEREAEELRLALERLNDTEELYRYTVELSRQMVWTADADKRLTSSSEAFSAVTGISPDVDPNDAWLMAVHPDDLPRVVERWNLELDNSIGTDFRMRTADGTYRLFRARAVAKRDDQGRVIRWYGYTQDIEDQRAAELAQSQAEERYRLAARATDDAVWDHDFVKGEIFWIDSASAFLGLPGGEGYTPGDYWIDNVHPDDRERVWANAYDSMEAGLSRWTTEYRFRSRTGQYVEVLDHGFVIRDAEGVPIRAVGAMADVTERRRAEAELKRMQAELIQVSRLSAMGAMASTLAHELNQPLTAVASYVRGGLRLLDGADGSQQDLRAALEAAEAGALKAGQIVRGLRELVSKRAVSAKPQDLCRIIEEANILAFVDEDLLGVTHRVEVDAAARWVAADSIQIQQVLINLVRNAIQAMAGRDTREVVIAAALDAAGMVEISVADTGSGLPSEAGTALFSPFVSTKPEGMGIGLSISRTIIEAHGGRIWAEDRPEGGAIFRFTLPKAEPSGRRPTRAKP